MAEYWPRIVDGIIRSKLMAIGALSIEGPKGCGKTETGKHFAGSVVAFSDPRNPSATRAARDDPSSVLAGPVPRLLDEWQTVPELWDAVRFEVDDRREPGQFILTGSSVPPRGARAHVGAGRFASVTMRTMSLYESRESSGAVSIAGLFGGSPLPRCESHHTISDIAGFIVRGGWPGAVTNGLSGGSFADDYVDMICRGGISLADGVNRDSRKVRNLMRSVARNISTLASMKTIVDDSAEEAGEGEAASRKTVSSYYTALEETFVVEDVPACGDSARSGTPLRQSPKRQMADPSIAASLLGLNEDGLMDDRRTMGFLFESLCDRDLRVYSESLGGRLGHYHDTNDLEVDAVIELRDGRWAAAEIKLGDSGIDEGARSLNRLSAKLKRDAEREADRKGSPSGKRKNPPSFRMVLTGSGYAYTREDGVIVVPIGCLGP